MFFGTVRTSLTGIRSDFLNLHLKKSFKSQSQDWATASVNTVMMLDTRLGNWAPIQSYPIFFKRIWSSTFGFCMGFASFRPFSQFYWCLFVLSHVFLGYCFQLLLSGLTCIIDCSNQWSPALPCQTRDHGNLLTGFDLVLFRSHELS